MIADVMLLVLFMWLGYRINVLRSQYVNARIEERITTLEDQMVHGCGITDSRWYDIQEARGAFEDSEA